MFLARIASIASGVLGGVLVVACASPPADSSDYELNQPDTKPTPAPSAEMPMPAPTPTPTPSEPSEPAAPAEKPVPTTAKTYVGTLAATSRVKFGGGMYCNYGITLKTVAIELTMLDTGEVTAATVKDLAVEDAVACQYPPMTPNNQQYTRSASAKTAGGVHIDFTGSTTNRPRTSLVVTVVPTAQGFSATLKWHRLDLSAPFDWTVNATVPLTIK